MTAHKTKQINTAKRSMALIEPPTAGPRAPQQAVCALATPLVYQHSLWMWAHSLFLLWPHLGIPTSALLLLLGPCDLPSPPSSEPPFDWHHPECWRGMQGVTKRLSSPWLAYKSVSLGCLRFSGGYSVATFLAEARLTMATYVTGLNNSFHFSFLSANMQGPFPQRSKPTNSTASILAQLILNSDPERIPPSLRPLFSGLSAYLLGLWSGAV